MITPEIYRSDLTIKENLVRYTEVVSAIAAVALSAVSVYESVSSNPSLGLIFSIAGIVSGVTFKESRDEVATYPRAPYRKNPIPHYYR